MSAVLALTRRSVRQVTGRPQFLAPVVVLPTLFLVAYTGGLAGAVDLDGFPPVQSILDFQLGGVMLLSAAMAGVIGGIAQALDIQFRFLDRLLVAPVARGVLVFSRVLGTGALGLLGGLWFLLVGLVFGARVESGVPGVALLLAVVALTAMAFGSLTSGVALRTGKAQAVQTSFMLTIVLTMLSSAFFPRALLTSPLREFAALNPLSYVAESLQQFWYAPVDGATLGAGLAALALLAALGALLGSTGLRKRWAP